jgi:hypothetical protein
LWSSLIVEQPELFKRTRALQKRISDSHPAAWATVGQRPLFGEAD